VTNWYVLRSKPLKEDMVWRQAQSRGFNTFYPRLRVRPVNPRARKVLPYFPGYLFVQADLQDVGLSTFQYMPYAIGLVCFGGEPANVPEELINAIRRRVEEIAEVGGELFKGLKRGDQVWIQAGPFADYQAIFDTRLGGGERVRVLMKMLNDRFVPVEIDAAMIEKVK